MIEYSQHTSDSLIHLSVSSFPEPTVLDLHLNLLLLSLILEIENAEKESNYID